MKAFARLALVGFVVGYPLDADAGAVEVTFKIASDCKPGVAKVSAKAKRSSDDVLVWRFASDCMNVHRMHACPRGKNPLVECAVTGLAKIGAPFPMYPTAATAPTNAAMCTINWTVLNAFPDCVNLKNCPKFYFDVVNRPADLGDPHCPADESEAGTPRTIDRASELALEVEP